MRTVHPQRTPLSGWAYESSAGCALGWLSVRNITGGSGKTLSEEHSASIDIVVMGHLLDDLHDAENFSGRDFPLQGVKTIIDVAERIGLVNQDEYFVVLNDDHLPIDVWQSHRLGAGDKLVFCPLLKGG